MGAAETGRDEWLSRGGEGEGGVFKDALQEGVGLFDQVKSEALRGAGQVDRKRQVHKAADIHIPDRLATARGRGRRGGGGMHGCEHDLSGVWGLLSVMKRRADEGDRGVGFHQGVYIAREADCRIGED